jgi:hypothetical protein
MNLQPSIQTQRTRLSVRCPIFTGTIALGSLVLTAVVPTVARADCDRACLLRAADSYLSDLSGHSPAALASDGQVVFTENNVQLYPGEALWKTLSNVGSAPVHVADPKTGQVAVLVAVEEGGRPALLAARLALKRGRIRELDTVVARKESATFLKPEGFANEAALMESQLAPAERRPREQLTAIATNYFRNLVDNDAPLPEFDDSCNRIENGVQSTNNPLPASSQAGAALNAPFSSLSCLDQFKTRSLTFVSGIRALTYPIIDEENGVVFATAIFDHDGLARRGSASGQLSASLPSPYSFLVRELFKIRDGRIVHIDAVLVSIPYGGQSAWKAERVGTHLP